MGLGVGRHSLQLQSFPGWGGGEKNKTNFKSSCSSGLQKRFGMLGGCKRNKANVEGGEREADKVSGYKTRDVSLPYDLMWVSAGCSH